MVLPDFHAESKVIVRHYMHRLLYSAHYVLMIIQNVDKFMHLYKGILPQVKQFVIDEFKVFFYNGG